MGKESVAVRVAELTAGSEAVLYACAESVEEAKPMLLRLPTKCSHHICNESVYLNSLMPAEHDVRGYAPDKTGKFPRHRGDSYG